MTDMITYAQTLPAAGETVIGSSFELGFGGKGANQAVMCAVLGATVSFVACVGDDVFGEMALENLTAHGIDTSAVTVSAGAASGAAPIWVDGSGENRIVVVPGANDLLSADAVEHSLSVARPDVVVCQLEIPEACVDRALRTAREQGAVSILNPAPMKELDSRLLSLCRWLIPNGSELDAIAQQLGLDPSMPVRELVPRVGSLLDVDIVVTLGAEGAMIYGREEQSLFPVAAPAAQVVDTTGAGDAFVGAFAYAVAIGIAPEEATLFGCACASASVEARGTQTSFPRDKRLAALKRTIQHLCPSELSSDGPTLIRKEGYGT